MALIIPAAYAPVTTSETRPGEFHRADTISDICGSYNKLLAEWYPGDLICHATSGYYTGGVHYPYLYWDIGAAREYCLSWKCPICFDFTEMTIKVTGYATGNDVDVIAGVQGTAAAAGVQTFTAGAAESTLTFAVSLSGLGTPSVLWVGAEANPAGLLYVTRVQAYHTAIAAHAGGALATSGAYPIDLARIAQGEPLSNVIPHVISRGIRGGTIAGASTEGILSTRPAAWTWSDDIQARGGTAMHYTDSATKIAKLLLQLRPRTDKVQVYLGCYGPVGSALYVDVTETTDGGDVSPPAVGAYDYITNWRDAGELNTVPNALNTFTFSLKSDGSNETALLGVGIHEVWT